MNYFLDIFLICLSFFHVVYGFPFFPIKTVAVCLQDDETSNMIKMVKINSHLHFSFFLHYHLSENTVFDMNSLEKIDELLLHNNTELITLGFGNRFRKTYIIRSEITSSQKSSFEFGFNCLDQVESYENLFKATFDMVILAPIVKKNDEIIIEVNNNNNWQGSSNEEDGYAIIDGNNIFNNYTNIFSSEYLLLKCLSRNNILLGDKAFTIPQLQ